MMIRCLLIITLFFPTLSLAQDKLEFSKPNLSKAKEDAPKIRRIPTDKDDKLTQELLNGILKEAGWFPNLNITVNEGLVFIVGHVENKDHLDWLIATADRLPTVIAVVNKAILDEPAVTDFSPATREFRRLTEIAKKKIPTFAVGFTLLLLFGFTGRVLYKLARRFWSRHVDNPFLISIISFSTLLPVYVLMLYMFLATMGLSGLASTIIGGTGVLGIILGFAFKGIAENFLSGMLLAIRSPFSPGDEIKVGDFSGVVKDLNMRGTTIMDYNGNLVSIPNAIVIQSIVTNITANNKTRGIINLTLSYGSPLEKVLSSIKQTLCQIQDILQEPAPFIVAEQLGPAGITLGVYYWFNNKKTSTMAIKSKVISSVRAELLKMGVDLPDQAREIILKRPQQEAPIPDEDLNAINLSETKKSEDAVKQIAKNAPLPGTEERSNLMR